MDSNLASKETPKKKKRKISHRGPQLPPLILDVEVVIWKHLIQERLREHHQPSFFKLTAVEKDEAQSIELYTQVRVKGREARHLWVRTQDFEDATGNGATSRAQKTVSSLLLMGRTS